VAEQLKSGFEPDGTTVPFEEQQPCKAQLEQAATLGFQRLGVKWEDPGRGRRLQEVSFASTEHRCFLSWFMGSAGVPLFYAFTPFNDGALVLTSCGGGWESIDAPTATRTVLPVGTLETVLTRHALAVRAMEEKGHVPFQRFDQQARLQATDVYYRNADIRSRTPNWGKTDLVHGALMLLQVASYFVVRLGTGHRVASAGGAAVACTALVAQIAMAAMLNRGGPFPWRRLIPSLTVTGLVISHALG
jgi:hypothetical protein